ncbi:hypothetical protein V0U79_11750 [Hyphobacterium sp. HN65]|uniref:DUF1311 domain-containing protein n=1 Tax=Hyphobacterium lacteum TaxID=3116575 RepID=A0ABU7LSY7_9PROT|nr:hypothetical protein [Hyphobacterium sp. HN65]MEE2527043.1 hypothetical protein [Hyphobacterium sp. HN65]
MRFLIVGLAFLSAGAHAQTHQDSFAQRALARALDDRCALFSDTERLALDGAYLQTRGDLLREGYSAAEIDQSYQQVTRNVSNRPCDDDNVMAIAADIRSAFTAWQRERFQDFVSAPSLWQANRPYAYDSWVISAGLDGDIPLRAGAYNREGEIALTIAAADNSGLASIALVMRDSEAMPGLHDPTLGGLLQFDGLPEWTRFVPPSEGGMRVLPVSRFSAEGIEYFRFSEAALDTLRSLDPREAVRIEAFDRQGRMVISRYLGVGDFAAALAFVRSSPDLSAGR